MHRRIMGGPEAIRLGQQFPGWVQYPGKPLGSRGLPSSSSGSGPGLNQPRRKPAGHAADRNQCTLHAASASCGARSSAGSPTSRPREYQVSRPRNRPERLTLLTRCVMVRRDQELPGPGSRAALRPVARSEQGCRRWPCESSGCWMPRRGWTIFPCRRGIAWNGCAVIAQASTASGSTTSGGSAAGGTAAMRTRLRSWTTTRRR